MPNQRVILYRKAKELTRDLGLDIDTISYMYRVFSEKDWARKIAQLKKLQSKRNSYFKEYESIVSGSHHQKYLSRQGVSTKNILKELVRIRQAHLASHETKKKRALIKLLDKLHKQDKSRRTMKISDNIDDIRKAIYTLETKAKLDKLVEKRKKMTKGKPLVKQSFSKVSQTQLASSGVADLEKSLVKNIPNGKAKVVVKMWMNFSGGSVEQRHFHVNVNGSKNQNMVKIRGQFQDTWGTMHDHVVSVSTSVEKHVENKTKIKKVKMGGSVWNLKHIVRNIINEDLNNDGKCVQRFLEHHWKKANRDLKLLFPQVKTSLHLLNLCKKAQCALYMYRGISGDAYIKYKPEKQNDKTRIINAIIHGNHIVQISSRYPDIAKRKKYEEENIVVVKNIEKEFQKLLNKCILPANIGTDFPEQKLVVKYYDVDGKTYTDNVEYPAVKYIINKLMEQKQKVLQEEEFTRRCKRISVDHRSTFMSMAMKIEHLYRPYEVIKCKNKHGETIEKHVFKNCTSFFPQGRNIDKGGFQYFDEEEEDWDDIEVIDKNKAYPTSLRDLPFLVIADYRLENIQYFDKNPEMDDIIDHYLYTCYPKFSYFLMSKNTVCTGLHLRYCLENGLEITVKECMKTSKMENYFKPMVNDMFGLMKSKENKSHVNDSLRIFIGQMMKTEIIHETNKIYNVTPSVEELRDKDDSFAFEYEYKTAQDTTDVLYFDQTKETGYNCYNRKPIAIQVVDHAKRVSFQMLKDAGVTSKDVKQIKTDSFAIKRTPEMTLPKMDKNNINGWKQESLKKLPKNPLRFNAPVSMYLEPIGNNVFYNSLAGHGKTYFIKNTVVPNHQSSYIILTPSHQSLETYKKEDYNCNTIQHFTFSYGQKYLTNIPKESTIIIDEFGLVDRAGHMFLYACSLLGKNIIAFGDQHQLLPPEASDELSSDFLKHLFKEHKDMPKNWRNDFPKSYYKELYENTIDVGKEVLKYSTDWRTCDMILCSLNTTRRKYNRMKFKHLGFESRLDSGVTYIYNGEPRKGLWKNKKITIENDKGRITCDNGEIELDANLVMNDETTWMLGYACTINSFQGNELHSFHYPAEDMHYFSEKGEECGRRAYTIISRLKGKVYKPCPELNEPPISANFEQNNSGEGECLFSQ